MKTKPKNLRGRPAGSNLQVTKSDFLRFLNCPEAFWLSKRKPDVYPGGDLSAYARKTIAEAEQVRDYARMLFSNGADAKDYSFSVSFQGDGRLSAVADVVKANANGTTDLATVKSSNSVKNDSKHRHLEEAAELCPKVGDGLK